MIDCWMVSFFPKGWQQHLRWPSAQNQWHQLFYLLKLKSSQYFHKIELVVDTANSSPALTEADFVFSKPTSTASSVSFNAYLLASLASFATASPSCALFERKKVFNFSQIRSFQIIYILKILAMIIIVDVPGRNTYQIDNIICRSHFILDCYNFQYLFEGWYFFQKDFDL